jgi:hypothetical protein
MELIGDQKIDFEAGMRDVLDVFTARSDVIEAHEDRFLPDVLE